MSVTYANSFEDGRFYLDDRGSSYSHSINNNLEAKRPSLSDDESD